MATVAAAPPCPDAPAPIARAAANTAAKPITAFQKISRKKKVERKKEKKKKKLTSMISTGSL